MQTILPTFLQFGLPPQVKELAKQISELDAQIAGFEGDEKAATEAPPRCIFFLRTGKETIPNRGS